MEVILAGALVLFIIFLMLARIYIWFEESIKDFGYYIRYELPDKIKPLLSIFKPKTELDKEIAEEEKEIKFLTEQKAKIGHLSTLKREKDRLYQEVETDAQNEDVGVPSCPQCGGTKVSYNAAFKYVIDEYEYYDVCSDCGTKVNYKEWMK